MEIKRNTDGLRQNAQRKRQETFEKVERGIQKLIKEKKPISFNAVAEASGVSKAWLYKEPQIKVRIEHLRAQSQGKQLPGKQKASDSSKDALIQALRAKLKKLEGENKELRRQNEIAYGQMIRVRELEKVVQKLQVTNERVTQQGHQALIDKPSVSSGFKDKLSELGVIWNSTLERLIDETPEGIVETAVESLREATKAGQVQNPGGFLNKAITNAWKANGTYKQKVCMETFNAWWKWAYKEGLVKAATQFDGVQYVLTTSEKWLPFEEAQKSLDSTSQTQNNLVCKEWQH